MAPPVSYTETEFADYMLRALGDLAAVLSWDAGTPQAVEAVYDALLDYGESNISAINTAAGVRQLRALGRRAIWRAVAGATAGDYSITDNGQKLERQQVHEHAEKMIVQAEFECQMVGADPGYAVSVVAVNRPHDPYIVRPDAERVLP